MHLLTLNTFVFLGAEDLKGKILKHRGTRKKTFRQESDILMGLFILVRQAEHEMKNGDPNVCTKNKSSINTKYY